MLVKPQPLASSARALRQEELDLTATVQQVCDRIDEVDGQVQALLPESGRRERLLLEAAERLRQYPDPAERPALFGILLGVKDIFRAAGFPTKAGSELPESLFEGPACTPT